MLTVEEIQGSRVEPEPEFLAKHAVAGEASVYEFEDSTQAEAAKIVLLSAAMVLGHGRVIVVPWQDKYRVLALKS